MGSFSANKFGLYDVHGNVWEWVEDCQNGSYDGAPTDGSEWESKDCNCEKRIVGGVRNSVFGLRWLSEFGPVGCSPL